MNFDAETQRSAGRIRPGDLRSLFSDLKPFALQLTLFVLASAAGAWAFVRIPRLLGEAIDLIAGVILSSVIRGSLQISFDTLLHLFASAALFLACNAACSVIQGMICPDVCSKYAHNLRLRVTDHSLHIAYSFLPADTVRSTHSLATEVIDTVNQSLNIVLSQGVSPAILLTAIIVSLFQIFPISAVLFLLVIPVYVIIQAFFPTQNNIEDSDALSPDEIISHLPALRQNGVSEEVLASFESSERLRAKRLAAVSTTGFLKQQLPSLLLRIALAVSILLGVRYSAESGLTVGSLISLIFFTIKAERPLSQTVQIVSASRSLLYSVGCIHAFLSLPRETAEEAPAPPKEAADLIIDGISFCYPGSREPVFRDFSARIPSRGITLLCGDTGVGKTTLVKLLLRFYDPQAGRILLDGKEIRALDLRKYRALFSVIGQEASLFDASIAENISYPQVSAPRDRLEKAIRSAGAADLIASLPNGVEFSPNTDGTFLSEGQIQQIHLARALFNEKDYIVLDESTSFLSREEETRFFANLKQISKNRCVIFISHKASSLAFADTVIRIEQQSSVDAAPQI